MKKAAKPDDTLVSVLIEAGMADHQAILGVIAEREGGEEWLADRLVAREIVSREDMTQAMQLIDRLRSDQFGEQRARLEIIKLRMRNLGHAEAANRKACAAIQKQARHASDDYPAVGQLVKLGSTGD